MRFLVDECIGPRVAQWLREQGHDVFLFMKKRGGVTMIRSFEEPAMKTGY